MDRFMVVGLCGSLRASSTNLVLLQAARAFAPPRIRVIAIADGSIAPHFNPDRDSPERMPRSAALWRELVGTADGLIVSCPEYAAGIPGAFKNALDWLVGEPRFYSKPVAIFSASQRSSDGPDALRLTLSTMSADIIESASVSLPRFSQRAIGGEGAEQRERIADALGAFADEIARRRYRTPEFHQTGTATAP